MSDEAVVGEDAAQVFVPWEDDSEQVESLALEPVDAVPDEVTEGTEGKSSSGAKQRTRRRQFLLIDKQVTDRSETPAPRACTLP
jgi:hypothetical protein